jgi:hypothetical protein
MSKTNGTHVPELVSRAELARRRGVSRSAVTQLCAGRLAAAVHGRQVDAAHPEVLFWLAQADGAPTATGSPSGSKPPKVSRSARAARRAGLKDRRDRSELFEINLRKRRAEVAALEIKVAERRNELISREMVERFVFGALRTLSARLLRDLPKTLAAQIPTVPTFEERKAAIAKANSEAIARTRAAVLRALRDGRAAPDAAE